jgi:hypothetical protein
MHNRLKNLLDYRDLGRLQTSDYPIYLKNLKLQTH